MQKNHLKGFSLSHQGTLAGSETLAYMVVNATIKKVMAPLEVGPTFGFN
jgi:hypothetical protein